MTERVGYWLDLDHAYFTYTNDYIESVWWALAELCDEGAARRGLQDPALLRALRHHPVEPRGGAELQGRGRSVDLDPLPAPARPDACGRWTAASGRSTGAASSWSPGPPRRGRTLANVGLAVHPDLIYRVVEHPGPAAASCSSSATSSGTARAAAWSRKTASASRSTCAHGGRPSPASAAGTSEGCSTTGSSPSSSPTSRGRVVLGDYVTADRRHRPRPHRAAVRRGRLPTGQTLRPAAAPDGRRRGQDPSGRRSTPSPASGSRTPTPRSSRTSKRRGLLLHTDRYRHSYPFCWRCDRPLLYYATDELVHPHHAREGAR